MRHRVGDDIDAHGIRVLDRETLEVFRVFAFSFPAVADVVVVTQNRNHSSIGIVVGEEMGFFISPKTGMHVLELVAATPRFVVNNLRQLLQVINVVEYLVVQGQFHRFRIRQHFVHRL